MRRLFIRHTAIAMRSLVPILAVALTGCTQSATRYPSLLPRAIESRSEAEPETPIALADPEPSTDSALIEHSDPGGAHRQRRTTPAQNHCAGCRPGRRVHPSTPIGACESAKEDS